MFQPNIYTQPAAARALLIVDLARHELQQRLQALKGEVTVSFPRVFELQEAMIVAETDAAWLQYHAGHLAEAIVQSEPARQQDLVDTYLDWLLLLPITRPTHH